MKVANITQFLLVHTFTTVNHILIYGRESKFLPKSKLFRLMYTSNIHEYMTRSMTVIYNKNVLLCDVGSILR